MRFKNHLFYQSLLFLSLCLFLSLASCSGCSCSSKESGYKIGVDPDFIHENFQGKDPYVLGFIEDVLIEISKNEWVNFEVFHANWDSMLQDLQIDKYDAVLSSLPLYNFNEAYFDFSESVLEIGPVLVMPKKEKEKAFKKKTTKLIGYLEGDMPSASIIETYPDTILKTYPSIPELFVALSKGQIDALMIDRMQAVSYINELYSDSMKIMEQTLSKNALRLVVKDHENSSLLSKFNRGLSALKKKGTYKELMDKWKLHVSE